MKNFLLLLALFIPATIAFIDVMAVSVGFHPIMQDFHASLSQTQWLLSAYTIGTAAFLMVIGRLSDLYGRKVFLMYGLIVFFLASLSGMLAGSMMVLIASRFFQGIGGAVMLTTTTSIMMHHFPKEQRASILSRWAAFMAFGMAAGPFLGGVLIHFISWRAIFGFNLPVSILSLLLTWKLVPESKDSNPLLKMHIGEVALLSLCLLSLVSALSEGQAYGWTSFPILGLIAISCGTGLALFKMEKSLKNPLVDFSFFRLQNFTRASLCGFLSYFYIYAWLFIFNIYLQSGYGLSPIQTGSLLIVYPLAAGIAAQIISLIIGRYIRGALIMRLGFCISCIAFIAMSTVTPHTSILSLAIMFALLGATVSMVNAPSIALATPFVPPHKTGSASGLIFSIRWFGGSLGVALITLIYQMFDKLSIVCIILAGVALLGVGCLAVRRE